MYDKNSAEQESGRVQKNDDRQDDIEVGDRRDKGPSELFIGSITFAVFIVFMTVWMYFSG